MKTMRNVVTRMKSAGWLCMPVLLFVPSASYGAIVLQVLTTPGDIAAFQTGATVQTFENVSGLPGVDITNFNSGVAVGAAGQSLFQMRNGGAGFITTSGGAAPAGLFNLTGGLTGAESGTHVLAPLDSNQATCFDSAQNCLMAFELLFEQGVQRVGFFMSRPATIALENDQEVDVDTSTPNIMRVGANPLFTQANVPAGFVTLTSTSANVNGVSLIMSGTPTFIDDVTYARTTSTTTTPEPASFALAGLALGALLLKRKLSHRA